MIDTKILTRVLGPWRAPRTTPREDVPSTPVFQDPAPPNVATLAALVLKLFSKMTPENAESTAREVLTWCGTIESPNAWRIGEALRLLQRADLSGRDARSWRRARGRRRHAFLVWFLAIVPRSVIGKTWLFTDMDRALKHRGRSIYDLTNWLRSRSKQERADVLAAIGVELGVSFRDLEAFWTARESAAVGRKVETITSAPPTSLTDAAAGFPRE